MCTAATTHISNTTCNYIANNMGGGEGEGGGGGVGKLKWQSVVAVIGRSRA